MLSCFGCCGQSADDDLYLEWSGCRKYGVGSFCWVAMGLDICREL